jgi:hypothetical protein
MIKRILLSICVFVVQTSLCMAQSNGSGNADVGPSVQGVELSITVNTNIFQTGSAFVIETVTRNSSTNVVTVYTARPSLGFDVLLVDNQGESYHILPPFKMRWMSEQDAKTNINPGEENRVSLPVTFADTIKSGVYILKVTRGFHIGDKSFTAESNSIKVTIIK